VCGKRWVDPNERMMAKMQNPVGVLCGGGRGGKRGMVFSEVKKGLTKYLEKIVQD